MPLTAYGTWCGVHIADKEFEPDVVIDQDERVAKRALCRRSADGRNLPTTYKASRVRGMMSTVGMWQACSVRLSASRAG